MTTDKVFNLSVFQFSHLKIRTVVLTSLAFEKFNELIEVKDLEQCLLYNKHAINSIDIFTSTVLNYPLSSQNVL